MRWPDRMERALRGLFEGRLPRLLGARLEPIEIAKRLAEFMDGEALVGDRGTRVPHSYRVHLPPAAAARMAHGGRAVTQDLCDHLAQHVRRSRYRLGGRLQVELVADDDLRPDDLRIEVCPSGPAALSYTVPIDTRSDPVRDRQLVLVAEGRRYPLPASRPEVQIGRALDNDVILDLPSVSRRHARLLLRSDHWLVEDLGSTHGTYVNGRRTHAPCAVRVGDRLRLGHVDVTLTAAADRPS